MEKNSDAYGAAVDAIYGAVETPVKWVEALQAIAAVTGDVGAIFIYPRENGSMATVVTPGLEAVQAQFQSTEWATRDLRYERALNAVMWRAEPASPTVTSRATRRWNPIPITSNAAPTRAEIFRGLVVSPSCGRSACKRGPDKPPFSDEELAIVARLGKHVEAALRIGVRLAAAERRGGDDNHLSGTFADVGEGQGSELSAMLSASRAPDEVSGRFEGRLLGSEG